jgi:hypothetical protein
MPVREREIYRMNERKTERKNEGNKDRRTKERKKESFLCWTQQLNFFQLKQELGGGMPTTIHFHFHFES